MSGVVIPQVDLIVPDLYAGLSIIVEMDGILEDVLPMDFVLTVRRYLHRKQNRET